MVCASKLGGSVILNAPNVHTGGGFLLLQAILTAWPRNCQLAAILDSRVRDYVALPPRTQVTWVNANVFSRFKAETTLSSLAKENDIVLCFHGLPPLLSNQAEIVVFLQNRLYFERRLPSGYRLKTYIRLLFERLVCRVLRQRVSTYVVQTPSMRHSVQKWFGVQNPVCPAIKVIPFVNALPSLVAPSTDEKDWDFVYVADGEAHKNHLVLLAAWRLLAKDGLLPSLAITLSSRDAVLKRQMEAIAVAEGVRLKDFGQMSHENVLALYSKSKAMIFPSISESFGLPLVEAARLALPILASELDFVRDVCSPVQTFDPTSPLSIARAVKRFLLVAEPPLKLRTPAEFLRELLPDMLE